MPQRKAPNAAGIRRLTRKLSRMRSLDRVARTRHLQSFRHPRLEPTVIFVVDGGDAWSAYLRRAMQRAGVNASQLARRSGLHRATISEWLNRGAGAITIQSVYLVADAMGENRADALRAAGNLPVERDLEVDLILASNRTDSRKAQMIERLMRRREEERQRRLDDIRFALDEGGDGDEKAAS